jgi:hypothetical protein
VPRIVGRGYVFKAYRADRGYLRHVVTGLRPVEVAGAAGRRAAGGNAANGSQSMFSVSTDLKTS